MQHDLPLDKLTIAFTQDIVKEEHQEKVGLSVSKKLVSDRTWE
jgi:hypothetical protein